MSSKRADVALVEAGFFESRGKACAAIAAGLVRADGRPVLKPSMPIADGASIEASAAFPWVSRGGIKLAAGLDAFGIEPRERHCLDVGASTGGFTDVLLSRGAAHVTAVDVGHGQMHASLRADPRVSVHESCDIRVIDATTLGRAFDLVVCDVSFISLRLVLPAAFRLAAPRADAVVLVKPQFEAGPARVRKGLVKDPEVREAVCVAARTLVEGLGWRVLGLVASPIAGGDGNVEFLLGARRTDV